MIIQVLAHIRKIKIANWELRCNYVNSSYQHILKNSRQNLGNSGFAMAVVKYYFLVHFRTFATKPFRSPVISDTPSIAIQFRGGIYRQHKISRCRLLALEFLAEEEVACGYNTWNPPKFCFEKSWTLTRGLLVSINSAVGHGKNFKQKGFIINS